MVVPTIVVIGGSFAGTKTAIRLDASLKSKADIILIEERDALYFTVGAPRSISEPGFAEHLWIPYDKLFTNNPQRSRVIKARAVQISPHEVKLSSGESVAFDYAVIATGAKVPAPGQPSKPSKAEGIAEANEILAAITKAKTVTVIGGGVVGIETAAEIATDYPEKKVTIIHSGASLAHKESLSARALLLVNQQLAALGVTVKLNTRAVAQNGSILPNGASYNLSPLSISISTGESIDSDVQFVCTGIAQPNSQFARSLGDDIIDKDGYIEVERTGQVKGFKNIFALGDVSNLDAAKLAYCTFAQSTLVGDNIASLIETPEKALKVYTSFKIGSFAAMSVGRNGGILQTPIGTFGSWATKSMRSKDFRIGQNWKDMNLVSTYKVK